MKQILPFFILPCLLANDPTIAKGELKSALENSEKKVVIKTKKTKKTEFDKLIFKGFYTSSKQKKLLLEFEGQILILKEAYEFALNEEKYQLSSFDDTAAIILDLDSKEIQTLTYRP